MPRRSNRIENVEECILVSPGKILTIMIDQRYAPYEPQRARVENLCGSFTTYVCVHGLSSVIQKTQNAFGRQHEMYHLHGNVSINQNKASFMGVRGMRSLEKLASALRLETPGNVVHMAVICVKLGKRVQVSQGGLIEDRVSRWVDHVRVMSRMLEYNNTLRFNITNFKGVFSFRDEWRPDNNDWSVTGRGTLLVRLTWRKLKWTQEVEDACLDLCNRTAEWLGRA